MKSNIINEYIDIDNEYSYLRITNTKGLTRDFKIDNNVIEQLKDFTWSIAARHHGVYCMNNKGVLLHRFLMKAIKGDIIDHIDRDTYNNTLKNLRITDYRTNNLNRRLRRDNSIGTRYIYKHKEKRDHRKTPYVVDTKTQGFRVMKRFATFEEAKHFRDSTLKEYLPEMYNLIVLDNKE